MSSANFVRTSFGAGPLSADKLQRLANNVEFLYDKMVRGGYYVHAFKKDESVRVQGFLVQASNNINNLSRYSNCYWPKPFMAGCIPVMSYGHYFTEAIIHSVGFKSIGGGLYPDHMGFRIEVYAPTTIHGDEWRGEHWFSIIGLGY